jgi:hypothetical protein
MKKLLTVIVGLLLAACFAVTAAVGAEGDITRYYKVGNDKDALLEVSLFEAKAATGNGTTVDLAGGDVGSKGGFYTEFYCEASRTGTTDIVLNLQTSKLRTGGAFANVLTPDVTLDDGDTDSLQFNASYIGAAQLLGRCVSGCDVGNTVTLKCVVGR